MTTFIKSLVNAILGILLWNLFYVNMKCICILFFSKNNATLNNNIIIHETSVLSVILLYSFATVFTMFTVVDIDEHLQYNYKTYDFNLPKKAILTPNIHEKLQKN